VLKSSRLRKAHIAAIVQEVNIRGFDGIDIDYESKKADTKQYFALFLRDLYKAIGKKFVSCTIEARTPLADRFVKIPADTRFANDFVAINKYCDRVRIMAYDQGRIDLKLNKAAEGLYMPIADPQWVEKAVRVAMRDIAKKKIFIGVATYGYESEVSPYGKGFLYDILWSFNPRYGTELAARFGAVPNRNRAGELSFLYSPAAEQVPPSNENEIASSSIVVPESVDGIATTTATTTVAVPVPLQRLVWWSDAQAIKDKVLLAKKLGVRGIAIFKIDGGEDPALWDALK
ncbi:MAG: glycosyl hydrolase family 18 protein, partial [Candidatus Sungiibacteriota bacterium]